MQLYALEKQVLIHASEAVKRRDYRCPECLGRLRVRSGENLTPHFYHIKRADGCHLQNKTAEHLQTQLFIQASLPGQNVVLEKEFPEIGRIADVVWEDEKIVFEVQKSPISLKEVKERNDNYAQVGYYTVWILHDQTFNKHKVKNAEEHLRMHHLAYFTNISASGFGIIYDQKEQIHLLKRMWKSKPFSLCLRDVKKYQDCNNNKTDLVSSKVPKVIETRIQFGIYFNGDLLERYLKNPGEFWNPEKRKKRSFWKQAAAHYTSLLNGLLELHAKNET